MQEQQAELEARLQHKQLQLVRAAEQFQPVMANLEKVWHQPVMSHLSWFCMSEIYACQKSRLSSSSMLNMSAAPACLQVHHASKLWAAREPLQAG